MLDAIERRIKLENSHPFAKLEDKTQILIPNETIITATIENLSYKKD